LKTISIQRSLRWGALLVAATLPAMPAHARTRHSEAWARDHFAAAERLQEALNGRPAADRTRRDYQRVINAYRNVYYGAPTSTKADPSVVAVAETLVEMGRRFDDDKILNEAIAQYKFLRKEYPGSKNRGDALFTIGEIYKDDLNDSEQARATFEEFLHRYPHNRLVDDAHQAIAELDRQDEAEKKAEVDRKPGKDVADKGKIAKEDAGKEPATPANAASEDGDQHASETRPSHLPRVTAIRHWSTPDYTRIAIDVEGDVKYSSQRISSPDRIFFDLRDTKLASTLVGKSFDVDDGFLKKIRVAQFQPGRTRVVLEVDNLSDYDAFLLPDPYRLIIDIHGKGSAKNGHAKTARETSTADVESAPKAGSSAAKTAGANDLRAEASRAPVTTDDVADGTKTAAKTEASPKSQKAPASGETTSGVKKVIVEADDDDPAPAVKTRPTARKHTAAASAQKTDTPSTADEATANDDSDDAAPSISAKSSTSHKSAPRAATTRSNADADLDTDAENDVPSDAHAGVHEAKPTSSGDRSLIRALGLKIGKIVIDPGHGGHDTGTIGPDGLEEKDLVLDVGKRLGKLLEARLGAEVVYTRKDDTFIPLETRTAIANQQRADLFVSIHANSSDDPTARGVETYYLNFTSSPDALDVAARENAVSQKSIFELQDLVKKIALKEKIEESREFAGDVEESLHAGLAAKSPAIRDRGVKKAPFIVLIGANMPSILAEISFVSNPTDERHLETGEYRQKIAESLYRGIAKYVNGLSGVKLASKMDRTGGQ
jgi:N-acetylmuramoyl-L-alanine amidase